LRSPADLNTVSAFMEIRVPNIHEKYQEWRAKGVRFLTEPKDRGGEIRAHEMELSGMAPRRISRRTVSPRDRSFVVIEATRHVA
jgi:hypothetical protein